MTEPNLESIIITNVIGLTLLVGLFVTSYQTRERRHLDDRMFTALIFVCAGCCICEPVSWLANANTAPLNLFLNHFCNTYCYIATNVYAYLWVLYVDLRLHRGDERISRWYPGLLVPTALLTLVNLGNLVGGYMYTIDVNGVYSREPMAYLNYAMAFVSLFYSIWVKQRYEREHGKTRFFPIALFLAPIFFGALVQALMFGISIAWTGVCVGLSIIYMSQQNELSYIDQLTGLYNRTYLDSALRSFQRTRVLGGGIMIDLDYFKDINDTFGHSNGDKALKQVAELLKESMPHNALVIRFAGDEFIVLLRNISDGGLQQAEADIRAAVSDFNRASNEPYELSLSLGTSMYRPYDDTTDEFLRRIDERMYAEKRTKHATR